MVRVQSFFIFVLDLDVLTATAQAVWLRPRREKLDFDGRETKFLAR